MSERHPDSPGGGPVEEELSDATRRSLADILGKDAEDERDRRDAPDDEDDRVADRG